MGKGPGKQRVWRLGTTRQGPLIGLVVTLILVLIAPATGAQPLSNAAPTISAIIPDNGATGVDPAAAIAVTFSEPVTLATGAVSLICATQQSFTLIITGGPTTYTIQPAPAMPPGDVCRATIFAHGVTDLGDPPAYLATDTSWSFTIAAATTVNPIINELDAATSGPEFIELYDGGRGRTSLTGLQVALYDGSTDTIITTIPLRDKMTDANGYFLISSDAATADLLLANGALLDGPAAVALYRAPAGSLPIGSGPVLSGLVDAVVYGSGPADSGLLPLLEAGQPQVDENSRGQAATDSVQRCPNGTGGGRQTETFEAAPPTPSTDNVCVRDSAPSLLANAPKAGSVINPTEVVLTVTFSERVTLAPGALALTCSTSGDHALTIAGGPVTFTATPVVAPNYGESCAATLLAYLVSDNDTDDPPDHLTIDQTWSFNIAKRVATNLLINEVDSDTPGQDTAEFIELFDGGAGNTDLSGLVLVLYNGATDKSYRAISLETRSTDGAGYFVVGNKAVAEQGLVLPDAALQNGPDAVALYAGKASDFPTGTAVTTDKLVDAFVYSAAGKPDPGLQPLLVSGEVPADENGRGQADQHASQRCPNGSGGQRRTAAFRPNPPTPGRANVCTADDAPHVTSTVPAAGATGLAAVAEVKVTFSEPVTLRKEWLSLSCSRSGAHGITTSGGPATWTATLAQPVWPGETCQATVVAGLVSDSDSDDPPDTLGGNVVWSFSTKVIVVADYVLINELDANTPGSDKAEFIELYDGGAGRTPLDGLALVLFNGNGAVSYASLGLDGFKTDANGYFVVGNDAVKPNLTIANGAIQNGPDAVALYAAAPAAFPSGTPLTTNGLLDAVVYGQDAAALLSLLNPGQPVVDEGAAGAADTHSLQRCPSGSGGPRNSKTIGNGAPTPGAANTCIRDEAPRVLTTIPSPDATGVVLNPVISVTFSEPVLLDGGQIQMACDESGTQTVAVDGGPVEYDLTPGPLRAGEQCRVTIPAASVTDLDTLDPPDTMADDVTWRFTTAAASATGILINEFDVDTAGTDTAEFIELYDGGRGNTVLDGLVVVLFNGQNDTSYRTIDLSGTKTDAAGYLLLGGPDVVGRAISLPVGIVQNGPDAIALFTAAPTAFPNGTAVTTAGLLDAVVYGTGDPADPGLLPLLLAGQTQIDESSLGDSAAHANQRCPNGQGGARMTAAFRQAPPTPGTANDCAVAPVSCGAPAESISAIQGTGLVSPMVDRTVIVEAVVTADFRQTLGGFFVQTPDDTASTEIGASRGLFVRLAAAAGQVKVGDRLRLSGRVAEQDQRTTLAATTVQAVCARNEVVAPDRPVTVPTTAASWEALESMLVTLGPATIAGNAELQSDGMLSMVDGQRPVFPTEILAPGAGAWAALQANQQRLWWLDDGRLSGPGDLLSATSNKPLRAGDTVAHVTGVVDGFEGGRRLHALEVPTIQATNPRPPTPALLPNGLRLVSVDLGLYSNGNGRGGGFTNPAGAQSAAEYARQRAKVVALLSALDADLIALNGVEPDGNDAASALADLLHEVNADLTDPYLALITEPPRTVTFPRQSALLYRPDRVSASAAAVPDDVAATDGNLAAPLVVTVSDLTSDQQFDLAIIHLLPRADCPTTGPDADRQDGQACHNRARLAAVTSLTEWLSRGNRADQTLVVGTWNAYALEDPPQAAVAAGFNDLTVEADYTQIEASLTGAAHRLLAGTTIAGQVGQTAVWHVNADEAGAFDFRVSNPASLYAADPYRAAATDPLVVDLRLGPLRAEFNTEPQVLIGQASRFRSTSTGPGALQYLWNFGDGSPPATAAEVVHTFRQIGTYTVTLTVTNGADQDSTTARIDVLPRRIYLPAAFTSPPTLANDTAWSRVVPAADGATIRR